MKTDIDNEKCLDLLNVLYKKKGVETLMGVCF